MTLLLSASLALAGTVRHALVVGANDGGGVLPPLKYAETDAERMASLLTELGEFDEELVTVLYQPTEAELRAALAHHAAVAEEWDDDLFTFYYSGHADAVGLRLGDERYHFEALKHDLRAIPSTVRLGVLDACRSGTITRLKGAQVAESILGADDAVAEGEAWLTASADDELAQESESLRGGFYTHYLMSGMRGAADLSGDGVVELYELHQYTYDRVVESTGRTGAGSQHPRLTSQLTTGTGVALTDVRRASAQLVLSTGDAGLVAVFRMPDRAELAEFTKTADREMVLAVPPGSYLVRRRFQESTYEARFGLADGGRFRVEEWGRPLLEASTVRGVGDPRVAELITESEEYQDRMNLAQSPVMAGAASLVVPGAGQWYNGEVWKGLAYFGGAATLVGGAVFRPDVLAGQPQSVGGSLWPVLGAALWGASVADAVYQVHRREQHPPRLGAQLAFELQDGSDKHPWPRHAGVSADLLLQRNLAIGLDRVGYTWGEAGWDVSGGSRVTLTSGERFRPFASAAIGLRHGTWQEVGQRSTLTRTTFGVGGGFRWYVVPATSSWPTRAGRTRARRRAWWRPRASGSTWAGRRARARWRIRPPHDPSPRGAAVRAGGRRRRGGAGGAGGRRVVAGGDLGPRGQRRHRGVVGRRAVRAAAPAAGPVAPGPVAVVPAHPGVRRAVPAAGDDGPAVRGQRPGDGRAGDHPPRGGGGRVADERVVVGGPRGGGPAGGAHGHGAARERRAGDGVGRG